MATASRRKRSADPVEQLLKKLLIAQLSLARVPQGDIARVVGVSKGDVNAIARFIKPPKKS